MAQKESVKVKDTIEAILFKDNEIKTIQMSDLIVTGGKDLMCLAVGQTTGTPGAQYIAIGSKATAPAVTQTTLGSEWSKGRLLGSFEHPTGSNYYRVYRTFGPGTVTGGVAESATFNKSGRGSGTMLNRGTFPVISKGAADSLKITHKLTFAGS